MYARTAVLITVMGVLTVVSAQSVREHWLVSPEERAASRSNGDMARERVAQLAGILGRTEAEDAFDGRTRSDLFMPHEVFGMLMNLAYLAPESRIESFRRAKANAVRQQGLPTDFWDRLELVAAFHIADERLVKEIGATVPKLKGVDRDRALLELAIRQRSACRSRAEALTAARREFGTERFDGFLYDAVAANMFHVADRLPSSAQLLRTESGCR